MEGAVNKNQFNLLASRAGFNSALRHFKTSLAFSEEVSSGYNLADVLNKALDNKEIQDYQIRPIVNILLADKFGYAYRSENLVKKITKADGIRETVAKWSNLQVVLLYYTSSGDTVLINPESQNHWEIALPLEEDELLICFVGSLVEAKPSVLQSAVKDVFSLLYGGKTKDKIGYSDSGARKMYIEEEEPEEEPAEKEESTVATPTVVREEPVRTGRQKMTNQYAVNVTNELFHNGNVEAWKRIIESYKVSHSGCEVHIWYEGEKINDINALFKWGKVKHGTPIMFSVYGEDIRDISKLRKYLFEGASIRFESFLHGHPGTVLELF